MRLHGWSLVVARVTWLVVTIITVGLTLVALPLRYTELSTVCTGEADICEYSRLLTPKQVGALEAAGISIGSYGAYIFAISVIFTVVSWLIGLVIFWRKSDDQMALLASLMLVTFGSFYMGSLNSLTNAFPVTALAAKLIAVLGFTSIILFLYTFPHGSFAPRWTAWLAIIWIVNDIISVLFPALMQEYAGIGFLSFFIPALGCIGVQIYRYRRVRDPVERQQAKWVVFGIVACFSSLLSFLVIARMIGLEATSPMGLILHPTVLMVCVMAIPISIGMAILKSRLWDIDVVINRALVYGSLTVTLLLVYIGSVVLL